MSNDIRQVRKIARAIKTLLETEGVKVKASVVMEKIQDRDLSNVDALKNEIANDMRANAPADEPKVAEKSVARKQRIETFMVANWATIKDNADVREALFNAYCQGRIAKDKRAEMKKALLSKCEPNQTAVVEDLGDETTEALAASLLGETEKKETEKYDF